MALFLTSLVNIFGSGLTVWDEIVHSVQPAPCIYSVSRYTDCITRTLLANRSALIYTLHLFSKLQGYYIMLFFCKNANFGAKKSGRENLWTSLLEHNAEKNVFINKRIVFQTFEPPVLQCVFKFRDIFCGL